MKWIFILSIVAIILFEGMGTAVLARLHIASGRFSAPYGAAVFLALCAIGYYPIQLVHGSFLWIQIITALVALSAVGCTIRHWRDVVYEFSRKEIWIIIVSLIVFLAVLYQCHPDLEYSDAPMYLNNIAQNIHNPQINLFNLYTGKTGAEWDALYLYQGYYQLVSVYASILLDLKSIPVLKSVIWGIGIIYSVLSAMLVVNIVKKLDISKRWQKIVLLVFALFYLNFYYWRIIDAYYGNTWRSFFITMLMFLIYRWLAGDFRDSSARWILALVSFAGIASSSSYLPVSFAALSIFAMYLCFLRRDNVFYNLSWIVLPLVIYACILLHRTHPAAGIGLALIFLVYYCFSQKDRVQDVLVRVDEWFARHAKLLFVFVLPLLLMGYSLYMHIADPDYLYDYEYFFRNHQDVDMVKDYFFVYSNWADNLINVLRWGGVVLVCRNALTSDERYLRFNFLMMIVIFMNPLCTPTIAKFLASNVFYRIWEVMFNPFTELYLLGAWMKAGEKKKWLPAAVSSVLILVTVYSNVEALRANRSYQYGFYVENKEDYDPLSKIEPESEEVFNVLKSELDSRQWSDQPVVISQAEGMRVYLPNVYQPITARDTYYPSTRIDQDLYDICRRHHPWDSDSGQEDVDYSKTQSLFKKYGIQYAIVRYWENPQLDGQLASFAENIYTTAHLKLYRIQ